MRERKERKKGERERERGIETASETHNNGDANENVDTKILKEINTRNYDLVF